MLRDITVLETQNGWIWAEQGTRRRRLADLLNIINADSKELAKTRGVVATRITYNTNTTAGHMVAQCLAEQTI